MENKSNSIDVINALDTKIDKDEFGKEIQNLADKNKINKELNDKICKKDLEKINEDLINKINSVELKQNNNLENILNTKADSNDFNLIKDAFQDMKLKMTQRIDDIDNDLDRLIENIKSQFNSINEDMKKLEKNIINNSNIEEINKLINNQLNVKAFEEDINSFKNEIIQALNDFDLNQKNLEERIASNINDISKENKFILENMNIQNMTIKDLFKNKKNYGKEMNEIKVSEISQNIMPENNPQLNLFIKETKKDIENILNILDNKIDYNIMNVEIIKFQNQIESKINILNDNQDGLISDINSKIKEMYEDISKELSNKITLNDVKVLINNNNNLNEEKINKDYNKGEFIKQFEEFRKELKLKLDTNIFNKVINQFNINFENIKKDINSTNNSKEIIKSLQTKANSEDQINKLFNDIIKKLNDKVNSIDFTTAIDNQAIINDTLCNENCIGRWFWNGGDNKINYAIPWDNQSINTSPDNFIWEKGKPFIIINEEGFYVLNLGIFADKRPSIQIVVDGEIIVNNQNNVNKKMVIKNTDINNIIGISIIEFVQLKKQSKLSVLCYGGKGNGFLSLKKL